MNLFRLKAKPSPPAPLPQPVIQPEPGVRYEYLSRGVRSAEWGVALNELGNQGYLLITVAPSLGKAIFARAVTEPLPEPQPQEKKENAK